MKKKPEITRWSRRYRSALRSYLSQGANAGTESALELGRQAASQGIETLDLALIHEKSLMSLVSPNSPSRTWGRVLVRAKKFFSEAVVPIEQTHRAARTAGDRVKQLTQTLRQRTMQSSASSQRLRECVARRQTAEKSLQKSRRNLVRLLRHSSRLQERVRCQTRRMLSAQENKRGAASRQLHDEIAQALLAIHLRLLTLKTTAKGDLENLEKEIAMTQQLLQQSLQVIKRVAHELDVHHET